MISVHGYSDPFTTVEVTLLDANDNNPMFIPNNIYEFNVTQDAPLFFVIGKASFYPHLFFRVIGANNFFLTKIPAFLNSL